MIDVDIRGKAFGDAAVLGPLRVTVAPGETVAILGPSGVGKSTLLRIVAGIDRAFEGRVARPDAMSIVLQEPTLLPWRSARANLSIIHPDLSPDRIEAALARVGLAGKEDLFPGQLSLGQQRRLALARAFAGRVEGLVLDEPFASLDAETADRMLDLTADLIAEHRPATLLVTHAPREAERLADRVLHLGGSPATLRDG